MHMCASITGRGACDGIVAPQYEQRQTQTLNGIPPLPFKRIPCTIQDGIRVFTQE